MTVGSVRPGRVRVFCERQSVFHTAHGRTWHATFDRDDLGNWDYVPVARSRSPQHAIRDSDVADARVPRHTIHLRGEAKQVGDSLYDIHPLGFDGAPPAHRKIPPGHPLATATITYVWDCKCGNALHLGSESLRQALVTLVDAGVDEISLDGLRYALARR